MRILYVAKHDSGGGDDEGAITHALTALGHEVQRLREERGKYAFRVANRTDLLFFHGWRDVGMLRFFGGKAPRVFWNFDLVEWVGDPSLEARNRARLAWMRDVLPHVELGFCTDGDWVERVNSGGAGEGFFPGKGKLYWLMQGADERVIGLGEGWGEPGREEFLTPLLFLGTAHGAARKGWVAELTARYHGHFLHTRRGYYGRDLANRLAGTKVVVAPDVPVTDRYWSNRVYVTLGAGGLLLHPSSAGLAEQYGPDKELVFYRDRGELCEKIDRYLVQPGERRRLALAGLERTRAAHLYQHRCRELLRVVAERTGAR